ncbi:hypothetical protein AJ79_03763 [Helicocarpus griseus UAMH5409]|uniref:tRNA(Phe) 7-[(3-amino-3-carboxypropyl)-4-demethylwyosine(37)-N(4)]-methyltransferase n=1 Tax=Helicocarpus griseus UAMH5409 TaxID=1447875 RepID=A0A2B7XVH6_9EURO|nr:hypothetical protein AJ79_03763 [Helicocarpus griseus UAMH5409]
MVMTPPTPGFETKKQKILQGLSVPDEEYTDLSPKGSVDAGIRDLIRNINQIPGLVTTSSCAGRISVFLEGAGKKKEDDPKLEGAGEGGETSAHGGQTQFAPTGGKGSGKWLFVSHEPVERDLSKEDNSLHKLFDLTPGDGKIDASHPGGLRLVRFHFEPMILHIMASSLTHAKPVLAAATTAGFRESGIQSLRCLDDSEAYPIVAVRSSGLALESIIGQHHQQANAAGQGEDDGVARSIVSEDYLRTLLAAANERFKTNSERRERFWTKLQENCLGDVGSSRRVGWEDPEARRLRKREEGLRRSRAAMEAKAARGRADEIDDVMDDEDGPSLMIP